jgi:hypothetical protein
MLHAGRSGKIRTSDCGHKTILEEEHPMAVVVHVKVDIRIDRRYSLGQKARLETFYVALVQRKLAV